MPKPEQQAASIKREEPGDSQVRRHCKCMRIDSDSLAAVLTLTWCDTAKSRLTYPIKIYLMTTNCWMIAFNKSAIVVPKAFHYLVHEPLIKHELRTSHLLEEWQASPLVAVAQRSAWFRDFFPGLHSLVGGSVR